MFPFLNDILDIEVNKTPPDGKFLLISESQNDGSFLLHHFLSFYLKGGCSVCFIALVQSSTHYNCVAQKLGVNLISSIQKGQLTFIEGLKYAAQCMNIESSAKMPSNRQSNPYHGLTLRDPKFSLKPLYEKISEEISKFQNDRSFLLLIDDVSVFLSLGVSAIDVQDFVHYCQVAACTKQKAGCLVTLVHADHEQGDSEEELLERQLIYKCDLQLHVKGLSSGHCREVHGQLEIMDHNAAMLSGRPSRKVVQYKIMDKNVTFFAPGNSASVL